MKMAIATAHKWSLHINLMTARCSSSFFDLLKFVFPYGLHLLGPIYRQFYYKQVNYGMLREASMHAEYFVEVIADTSHNLKFTFQLSRPWQTTNLKKKHI
jgi:hypothetical protein